MDILITGGAGYIGSVLTRRLLDHGYNVCVLDNLTYGVHSALPFLGVGGYRLIAGNVLSLEDCEYAVQNVQVVIHLAAIVGEPAFFDRPSGIGYIINTEGTKNIYNAAKKVGAQFIFASTCSNYGQAGLATEDTPLNPIGDYAQSKVDCENWLCGKGAVILRFATAFGFSPRMRLDLIVQQFVKDAISKSKIRIYAPSAHRPLCHVEDIAKAVHYVITSCPEVTAGQVYNVGGHNVTKKDLAAIVQKYVSGVHIIEQENENARDYSVSFDKIKQLGFVAERQLDPFIERLVKALRMRLFDGIRCSNTTH